MKRNHRSVFFTSKEITFVFVANFDGITAKDVIHSEKEWDFQMGFLDGNFGKFIK